VSVDIGKLSWKLWQKFEFEGWPRAWATWQRMFNEVYDGMSEPEGSVVKIEKVCKHCGVPVRPAYRCAGWWDHEHKDGNRCYTSLPDEEVVDFVVQHEIMEL